TGIVGFCAVEGVSLALSDVLKDTRYYRGVSDRVHYETRSILCSPVIAHGRTFGCMELVNRRESPMFSEYEGGMLSYIAHQGALCLDTLGWAARQAGLLRTVALAGSSAWALPPCPKAELRRDWDAPLRFVDVDGLHGSFLKYGSCDPKTYVELAESYSDRIPK